MITTEKRPGRAATTVFDRARESLGNRYVYALVSARARGLSIGVNLNPTRHCNFDCIYCEVERSNAGPTDELVDLNIMASELEDTLNQAFAGRLCADFPAAPPELLQLRHVAVSGDGEPTLCPNFGPAMETIVHLRASVRVRRFKIVLITNASRLDRPQVSYAISLLTGQDEVWAKLDGGTQRYIDRINRTEFLLPKILENIRNLGRQRPVIIQTMIPAIHGQNPFLDELPEYVARLRELKDAGTVISQVQIYSANRPTHHSECGHLSLNALSEIAGAVRAATGLRAEVF